MSKKATIYARYSSAAQGEGYSIERQITQGTAALEERGWTIHQILTDEGRSAYSGGNRKLGSALHQFELEAREGLRRGEVLAVENLDRLSRQGAKATAQMIWALNEAGVDVFTWNDGVVYRSNESGDLLELFGVIIKAQMAHEESLKKSQRTRASWDRRYNKLKSGETTLIGYQPSWIIREGDGYAVAPGVALTINRIFDLYNSGVGVFRIAAILNEERVPTWSPKAKGWYEGYLYRILGNRAVIGDYVTLKGEVLRTNFWPPVVSKAKWAQAQSIRSSRKVKPTGGRNWSSMTNLLQGLVECGACGGKSAFEDKGANSVTRYKAADGSIREYPRRHYQRLRCSNNRRRKGCDNSTLFDYKILENKVLDFLLSLTLEDQEVKSREEALREQIATLDIDINDTADRITRLVEQLETGLTSPTISQRLQFLEQHSMELSSSRDSLELQIEALSAHTPPSDLQALVGHLRASLVSSNESERVAARARTNNALQQLIEKIELHQDQWVIYTEFAVWVFDLQGNVVGGQAI